MSAMDRDVLVGVGAAEAVVGTVAEACAIAASPLSPPNSFEHPTQKPNPGTNAVRMRLRLYAILLLGSSLDEREKRQHTVSRRALAVPRVAAFGGRRACDVAVDPVLGLADELT